MDSDKQSTSSETAKLEEDFVFIGQVLRPRGKFRRKCHSGRPAGGRGEAGDKVIVNIGAEPVRVDTSVNCCIDTDDLKAKIDRGARFLCLSYMRGDLGGRYSGDGEPCFSSQRWQMTTFDNHKWVFKTRSAELRKREGLETVPLSFQQERLWQVERIGPAGSVYYLTQAFRCKELLSEYVFKRAVAELLVRHEALSSRSKKLVRNPGKSLISHRALPS